MSLADSMSIGLVSFNSAPDLRRTLPRTAEIAATLGVRVLVYDNASEDDSVDFAECIEGVVIQRGKLNRGFAHGVNELFVMAQGRDMLLVNPDVQIENPSQVHALLGKLTDLNVGVVAPLLLNPDGSPQTSARRFPTVLSMVGRASVARQSRRAKQAAREYTQLPPLDGSTTVDWVIGAAMLISNTANTSVGGWDDGFFLYLEDVDFCFRLAQRGWCTVYEPRVAFHHTHHRASNLEKGSLLNSPARRHHLRSAVRFFAKHRSPAPRPQR
jgi:N-acetylglucosaminyl-diphospho-decaprenol L-rhamnosyltransferase